MFLVQTAIKAQHGHLNSISQCFGQTPAYLAKHLPLRWFLFCSLEGLVFFSCEVHISSLVMLNMTNASELDMAVRSAPEPPVGEGTEYRSRNLKRRDFARQEFIQATTVGHSVIEFVSIPRRGAFLAPGSKVGRGCMKSIQRQDTQCVHGKHPDQLRLFSMWPIS